MVSSVLDLTFPLETWKDGQQIYCHLDSLGMFIFVIYGLAHFPVSVCNNTTYHFLKYSSIYFIDDTHEDNVLLEHKWGVHNNMN